MSNLPPPIYDQYFDDLDGPISQARAIIEPVIRGLRDYLNGLPCLSPIPHMRVSAGKLRRLYTESFPRTNCSVAEDCRHWYFYNRGARSEMQFNVGMYSQEWMEGKTPYVRVGIAFMFSGGKYGNPGAVQSSLRGFAHNVEADQRGFLQLFNQAGLEVEDNAGVNGANFMIWLQNEAQKQLTQHTDDWVFIGRLLRRGTDKHILEDPTQLNKTITDLFSGLIRYYHP